LINKILKYDCGHDLMNMSKESRNQGNKQNRILTQDKEIGNDEGHEGFRLFNFTLFGKPKFHFFKINFIMFIICLIWALIFFIVPAMLPANSVDLGDEGTVGVNPLLEDNEKQIAQINNSFARSIYNFGDSTCHQKNSRSLFINGNQMPLCARDIGIYLGFAIGALVVTLMVVELRMWWIIGSLIPIGVDGLTQAMTAYESTNPLRLITGGIAGMMTTMVLGVMFYEIYVSYKEKKKKNP
jgi:uncharacterized membrane protein